MERSLFPEGVEVHQTHLANTEDTKAYHIKQRFIDLGQTGAVTGLAVTVSTLNPATVDIGSGRGYTSNGELIEVDTIIPTLALANYNNNENNYVCLVYTETSSRPEAHTANGSVQFTRATGAYRVRVYWEGDYFALPASSDDLSIDARDRIVLCGIVNANGLSVPLVSADITTTAVPTRVLGLPAQMATMPGVEVLSFASTTPTTEEAIAAASGFTQATFTFTRTATEPFAATLSFRAPLDAVAGAAVVITAGGTFTLTSTAGRTATVLITEAMLQRSGASSIVVNVDVVSIYTEALVTSTARDEHHRRKKGVLVPTTTNPHGQKTSDLSTVLEAPHGVRLGTGLTGSVGGALVARSSADHVSASGSRVLIWESTTPSGPKNRVYSVDTGFGLAYEITHNARWFDNGAGTQLWYKDLAGAIANRFDIGNELGASTFKFQRQDGPTASWLNTAWASVPLNIAEDLISAVTATFTQGLTLGTAFLSGSDPMIARILAKYSTIAPNKYTLLLESSSTAGAVAMRMYMSTLTFSNYWFAVTINARWDQSLFASAGGWVRDNASYDSYFLSLTTSGFAVQRKLLANPSPWVEAGWDATALNGNANGIFTAYNIYASLNQFITGTSNAGDFTFNPNKSLTKFIWGHEGAYSTGAAWARSAGGFYKQAISGSATVVWPISLPHGATITSLHLNGEVLANSGLQIKAAAFRAPVLSGAVIGANNLNSAGPLVYTDLPVGGPTIFPITADQFLTIDENYFYWVDLQCSGTSEAALYALKVVYTQGLIRPKL